MAIDLEWLVSTSTSTLHASEAMFRGEPLVDKKVAEALAVEVDTLRDDLLALGIDGSALFEHLVPATVRFDQPRQRAEFALTKLYGPGPSAESTARLARRLIALEAAFQQVNPRALEELELRAEPLRGQWEARGPGLMAGVGRLTEPEVVPQRADVILVQPVLGGGGAAHLLYNSVRMEAVLANPIAELPEVVRLAWLLAQLNLDLPKFQGNLHRDRLRQIGPLALIPPVLAAAQDVELARCDEQTLSTALAAWNLGDVDGAKLLEWWETYQASSPTWDVALGGLDRMLVA